MNKLTPAEEKRFDEKAMSEWDIPTIEQKRIKQHLADELARKEKEIIEKILLEITRESFVDEGEVVFETMRAFNRVQNYLMENTKLLK